MKIAIIAHSLYPIKEPFAGGLEMVTFLLCRTLIDKGHQVDLYARHGSDASLNPIEIPTGRLYPSAFLAEVSKFGQGVSEVKEMLAYSHIMNSIAKGDYDIIHNHSLHYMPILMGNGLNVPMLTSIHTPPFTYLQIGAYGVETLTNQTFTMVSRSLAKTWSHIVPEAEVVYNGIDLSMWKFIRYNTGNYLFWYGRICPEKGTHLAIAAAQGAGIPIKLAGPVSNKDYYEDCVRPMLSDTGVDYLGHLSQKELGPVLGNARAMLFTSVWEEPYGLTLAESLACGTPVIAFDGGATREIISEDTGIIVPMGDVAAMSDAVADLGGIRRVDCRELAEGQCSHHMMVENYLELYDRLLERQEYMKFQVS